MKKIIILLTLSIFSTFLLAQHSVEVWQVVKEKRSDKDSIRSLVRLNEKGVADLKKMPDFLEIRYLNAGAFNDSIRFNEKNGFVFYMNGTGNNSILPSDLQGNILRLTFQGKYLTGIGSRVIRGREIDTKKVFIQIVEGKQAVVLKEEMLSPMQILSKPQSKACPIAFDVQAVVPSTFLCQVVDCCKAHVLKPVDVLSPDFWNKNKVLPETPKYRLVYDARPGAKSDLMLLRYNQKLKGYEVRHLLFPKANRIMTVSVIGVRDSTYVIDSSSSQLNIPSDSIFSNTFKAFGEVKMPVDKGSPDSTVPDVQYISGHVDLSLTGLTADSMVKRLRKIVASLSAKKVIGSAVKNELNASLESVAKKLLVLEQQLVAEKQINEELERQIQILSDSLAVLNHKLQLNQRPGNFKAHLVALDQALEQFNYQYRDIDFQADAYQKDLLCLQLKIKQAFGLAINNNAEDLANQLAAEILRAFPTEHCYYNEFHSLIEKIAEQYNSAVDKRTRNIIFTRSVPVPNHDLFKIRIGNGRSGMKPIYEQEFHTSLGFKVDVSTGVFITGLKDKNYSFVDSTVKYRRDSLGFTPSNGALTDTTGRIVVGEGNSRYRVGIGVLLHAYPRISGNYNFGLTAGFLTTTNIDLNLMAGLSAICGSGRRLIVSGGLIWGKATRLSSSLTEGVNRYTGGVLRSEDARYAKPIFYNTQTSVVPTVSDWQQSFFFGVSWNLSK